MANIEIFQFITTTAAVVTLVVVLKRFLWDSKKQKQSLEDAKKARDEEILSWITNAIAQQNQHCKLLQKYDINGLRSTDESMKQKQSSQDNEIGEIKRELRVLSEAVVKLTTEISNLKDAINKMEKK